MFEQVKEAIFFVLETHGEIQLYELAQALRSMLHLGFDDSISWCVTTVILDLEARGLIERIPSMQPQCMRATIPSR